MPNLQVVKLDIDISTGPESPVFETSIYLNLLDSLGKDPIKVGLSERLISVRLANENKESGRTPFSLWSDKSLSLEKDNLTFLQFSYSDHRLLCLSSTHHQQLIQREEWNLTE